MFLYAAPWPLNCMDAPSGRYIVQRIAVWCPVTEWLPISVQCRAVVCCGVCLPLYPIHPSVLLVAT